MLWLPGATRQTWDTSGGSWTDTGEPKGLLHTTETTGWPSYSSGKSAPHLTVKPIPGKGVEVRQHIPFDRAARALRNPDGGVQTNRDYVFQIELVGTCDPSYQRKYGGYYWPAADDAVLLDLYNKVIKPLSEAFNIPERAPEFLAYPASYGNSRVRMGGQEFDNYAGWLGHMHAPENVHGDPGAFPWARMMALATGSTPAPSKPVVRPAPVRQVGDPELHRGSKGEAVKTVQRAVGTTADGIFGPKTEAAVKAFQKRNGLVVDGIVGPKTWAAIRRPKPAPKPKAKPTIPAFPGTVKRGSRGSAVRAVQSRLKARGWRIDVDGIFGPQTDKVVRAFQKEKRLVVDGVVGPKTWAALWTAPITP